MKRQAKGRENVSVKCNAYPIKDISRVHKELLLIKMDCPRLEQKMQPKTEISSLAQ